MCLLFWEHAVALEVADVSAKDSKGQFMLEQSILDYFAAHPNAADTVDGIIKWWLGEQGVSYSKSEVETALESLASKGNIAKTFNKSGETIYANRKYIH